MKQIDELKRVVGLHEDAKEDKLRKELKDKLLKANTIADLKKIDGGYYEDQYDMMTSEVVGLEVISDPVFIKKWMKDPAKALEAFEALTDIDFRLQDDIDAISWIGFALNKVFKLDGKKMQLFYDYFKKNQEDDLIEVHDLTTFNKFVAFVKKRNEC